MSDRYASLKQGLVGCWIPSISGSGLLLPDLSGRGNNGSLVGMDASDWVSSQYGRALDFDGTDDYIPIGTNIPLAGKSITCSAWIYRATVGNLYPLMQYNTSLGGNSRNFYFGAENWTADGQLTFIAGTNTTNYLAFSGPQFVANRWNHIGFVVFFDGGSSTIRMFLNGAQVSTTDRGLGARPSTFPTSTLVPFEIQSGTGGAGTRFYGNSCQIDDIRVYSRLLSDNEIRLLSSEPGIGFKRNSSAFATRYAYKPDKPRNYSVIRNRDPNYSTLRHGLVAAYCPSISGQGNVLPDLVGGNHGQLTNMTAEDWVSSGDGRALDFDGVNDFVSLGDKFGSVTTLSVSAYCFLRSIPAAATGAATIAGKWGNEAAFDSTDSFTLNYFSEQGFRFFLGGPNDGITTGSGTIATNTIYHVCATWRQGLARLFVNGVELASKSITGTTNAAAGTEARIGRAVAPSGSLTVDGWIDDIRVYNRALSESEIKLLASKRGIGLQPRNTHVTFTDLGVQKTYSVVRVKETDYGTLRQGLVGAWCPSLPNGGSGNTLPDVSGYGNHGVLTNMSPDDWVSSQYGRALDFDGSDDRIVASGNTSFTNGVVSVSGWMRRTGTAVNNNAVVFSKGTLEGNANSTCALYWNEVLGWSWFVVDAANNLTIIRSNTVTSQNQWVHVGGIASPAGVFLYLNGVLANSTTTAAVKNSTHESFIGGASVGGGAFTSLLGQVDDVRAYSRALTEPEIRLLASRPGIGLRQESHRNTFYQFPSGSRRKRILTGMP